MDQQAEYPEEPLYEPEEEANYDDPLVAAPPLEAVSYTHLTLPTKA